VPFPGREALKQLLTVVGAKEHPRFHVKFSSYSAAKVMVEGAGLAVVRCVTLGFGPFTFLARDLLSEPRAIRLHGWLQERADRRVFGLRSLGAQHLILARKV
jgi:hypothetical protein